MSSLTQKSVLFLSLISIVTSLPASDRDQRATFYFTNPTGSTCQSEDGRDGYCLFQGCLVNNLQYQGRCAFGLASCCLAETTCDKTTNANNTYFVNPGFPLSTTSLGSCTMTVKRRTKDICQIRLDFVDFELEQPNKDGICFNDAFSVEGAKSPVPTLCGSNKGQHMYFDVEPNDIETPIILSINVKDITLLQRTWNIKISQIECASTEKAPSGCMQYYTGLNGTARSFNFNSNIDYKPVATTDAESRTQLVAEGTRQLANTEYTICVRQETDHCSVSWEKNEDDGQFAFTVTGDVTKAKEEDIGTPKLSSTSCDKANDFVLIPNGVDEKGQRSERICGLGFAQKVTTNFKPFVLHAHTGPSEDGDALNRGFSLKYSQNDC